MLPNPTPTLSEVTEQYQHWRSTRSSSYGETPEHLQRQTVALLAHYRISEIITTLGLCHKAIKRWHQRWGGTKQPIAAKEAFVVLPTRGAMEPPDRSLSVPPPPTLAMKLSHQRGDGTVVCIEAQLPQPQWQTVLQMLQPQAIS